MRLVATLALILLAAPACSPTIDIRGNLPNPDQLVLVKPGDVSRDDVANMLGTPSSTAVFDDETWYYISMRTETKTFFKPKVLDRKVVAVRFDP
ncbi:MAG: outer membrane protein assembly factor BamE, partial [Rhodospirillales bacterium]|nr:outer membrane protein assembly factor BamE [Rhodospirillales bacterium]